MVFLDGILMYFGDIFHFCPITVDELLCKGLPKSERRVQLQLGGLGARLGAVEGRARTTHYCERAVRLGPPYNSERTVGLRPLPTPSPTAKEG